MTTPLEQLNAQMFREQLHTRFKTQAGEPPAEIALELLAVEEQERPGIELFSLHFQGPYLPRLPQQTHRLEHEKMGAIEIFMTPISASQQQGTVYECIFHRFRKK